MIKVKIHKGDKEPIYTYSSDKLIALGYITELDNIEISKFGDVFNRLDGKHDEKKEIMEEFKLKSIDLIEIKDTDIPKIKSKNILIKLPNRFHTQIAYLTCLFRENSDEVNLIFPNSTPTMSNYIFMLVEGYKESNVKDVISKNICDQIREFNGQINLLQMQMYVNDQQLKETNYNLNSDFYLEHKEKQKERTKKFK